MSILYTLQLREIAFLKRFRNGHCSVFPLKKKAFHCPKSVINYWKIISFHPNSKTWVEQPRKSSNVNYAGCVIGILFLKTDIIKSHKNHEYIDYFLFQGSHVTVCMQLHPYIKFTLRIFVFSHLCHTKCFCPDNHQHVYRIVYENCCLVVSLLHITFYKHVKTIMIPVYFILVTYVCTLVVGLVCMCNDGLH
jgi:hypothetical protein